ncbi:fimbria/pilus outer membrane usher protein [Burkholderia sp. GS2Y]|uniref:Fimbria/pilus outer membrane usher protein n=1 Tax=Burkholderia theae TaxID=3143496 RepID=A0ABU9WAS9_9BURK
MLVGLVFAGQARAEVEFNELFLKKGDAPVELKYFERGSAVPPGNYDVDVYLNGTMVKRQTVLFRGEQDGEVKPAISLGMLKTLGVDIPRLTKEQRIPVGTDDGWLVDMPALADGASVSFDVNTLSLRLSVPQAYVLRTARGYVDPSLWDDGVTAAYTNYQVNVSRNTGTGSGNSNYQYLNLRSGLNVGGWRFRNESSYTNSTGTNGRFSINRSYAEHAVRSINGKAAVGELYSSGEIFDSVRFIGAQVSSDLGMLPENELGFAPVVRGIAESNAVVEVRQNGYVIHSVTVPPGAFEISDIYPSGSNGDLQVRIIEADGRVRTFSQPYSYLPVMIRQGGIRYSFAAGEYRVKGESRPKFMQGTLVYGLSADFTGYGGLIAAQNYGAINLGVGLNTRFGGLSLDVTHSRSQAQGRTSQGQSVRFQYSKTLNATDTTFTMAGYRYSSDGYRTFGQHVEDTDRTGDRTIYERQKNRFDINVNQSLSNGGSLFASFGETSYWNRPGSNRSFQFGYSGAYRNISYSVAMSRTQDAGSYGSANTQFSASISIPLGKSTRSHRFYTSAVSSLHSDTNVQAGVSGSLNDSNTINYSVQTGYNNRSGGSGGGSLGWDTPVSQLSASYNQDRYSKHMDVGAAGSLVVHRGGVTFGQTLGETFAVAAVPEVSGVGISGTTARTDWRGYAVVPYLQPYRHNWLTVDTATIGTDTEIAENSKSVVPTRGAIVKTSFAAESGRRVQFDLTRDRAGKIPFGAQAYDENGKVVGMVDNQSRLLVFGIKDQGSIDVRWGDGGCKVNYRLQPQNKALTYERQSVRCALDMSIGAN